MNLTTELWLFLGTVLTLVVNVIITLINRKKPKEDKDDVIARTRKLQSDITENVLRHANAELQKRDSALKELEERVAELEDAVNIKDDTISLLEKEKGLLLEQLNALKMYIRRVLHYLKEHEIEHPEPPPGLLDTQPLNKNAKK